MKKQPLLSIIVILCLISMACSLLSNIGASKTQKTPVITSTQMMPPEATAEPTETSETATETSLPAETPATTDATETPEATQPAEATATGEAKATPTIAPTASKSGGVDDTFDQESKDWSKPVIVTTQARVLSSTFKVSNGHLVYELKDKETYAYQFYSAEQPANVSVETTYTNQGELINGVVLTCRAAADNSTWYEARVSNSGPVNIYLYDRSRKEKSGKNPYVELGAWATNFKSVFPDKPNTVKFTCNGEKLSIDINNGLKKFETSDKTLTGSGLVGLGAISHENSGVSIAFDEFKASPLP